MRSRKLDRTRRLILASSSERRIRMFRETGLAFEAIPPDVSEPEPGGGSPEGYTLSLAAAKARAVAAAHVAGGQSALVVGADTIVVCGDRIIGKPSGRSDAIRILSTLSGRPHMVVTGVAMIWLPEGLEESFAEKTRVRMRVMSGEEIAGYVASGEADGRAGAYAIQENGDRFIESLEGSFLNVVGFPLVRFLEKAGVGPEIVGRAREMDRWPPVRPRGRCP
ncbi:MAG: Maf family protein [Planctomycetota bacterium]|nr:Maf family protein [Planctomycetota bacterium]